MTESLELVPCLYDRSRCYPWCNTRVDNGNDSTKGVIIAVKRMPKAVRQDLEVLEFA